MKRAIDVSRIIKSPDDIMRISWEVDGASGSTDAPAWRGQFEIDNLERAGYRITGIARVHPVSRSYREWLEPAPFSAEDNIEVTHGEFTPQ